MEKSWRPSAPVAGATRLRGWSGAGEDVLRLNPLWVSSLQLPRETSGARGGLPWADAALVC